MGETREFIRKNDSIRFVKGYNEEGKYNSQWDFDAMAPAGSFRSTASDMLIYANAQLGKAPAALEKDIRLTHEKHFQMVPSIQRWDGIYKTRKGRSNIP